MRLSISKSQEKFIRRLQNKKFREDNKLFGIQGEKLVLQLLKSKNWRVNSIYITDDFFKKHEELIYTVDPEKIFLISKENLSRLGYYESNNSVFAVVSFLDFFCEDFSAPFIILDKINNPGNLGCIIRTANWFGIKKIVCSEGSVDFYNPKVLQSSMGAFLEVVVTYENLENFLEKKNLLLYAADLFGKDIYDIKLREPSVFLFGSESHGISKNIRKYVKEFVKISGGAQNTESLNLSVAVGIICHSWRL